PSPPPPPPPPPPVPAAPSGAAPPPPLEQPPCEAKTSVERTTTTSPAEFMRCVSKEAHQHTSSRGHLREPVFHARGYRGTGFPGWRRTHRRRGSCCESCVTGGALRVCARSWWRACSVGRRRRAIRARLRVGRTRWR